LIIKKIPLLLYNTLLITAASLILRSAGLYMQSYITGKIGAEGVGLFQLILSVQSIAVTVATSGIRYSATRLVSEELGSHRLGYVVSVMRRCFVYAGCFSLSAFAVLYGLAGSFAVLAGDERIGGALKLLSFGLPFLALNSVIGGYFTAVQRPWKGALIQIFEQASMIAAVLLLLPLAEGQGLDSSCSAIALSGTLADAASLLLGIALFYTDRRKYLKQPKTGNKLRKPLKISLRRSLAGTALSGRLLRLSLPLALSSYARTTLSSLQHIMVPSALKRSGESSSNALSTYGTLHGMAFPVLSFPTAFFLALADMLIPELTEAQVRGNQKRMDYVATHILSYCLFFSVCMALIFFFFGKPLGLALYNSAEAGIYIKLMAPLVVVMYMDMVTDGMLKGLGLQLDSMIVNIIDAFLCIILVYFLVPVWAVKAYVGIIFFSECFNFVLSFIKLSKVVDIKLSIKSL
jgi:stage V sporulation protein B